MINDIKLIDTHSHLFLDEFTEDLNQVIDRARSIGITKIFMPNIDSSTVEPMMEVATENNGYCFPMIGLHPTSVNTEYEKELHTMKSLLEKPNCFKAIGEVGVDLYWDKTFYKEQENAFDIQIQWALEYGLPLVIHSRNAFDEIYNLLVRYSGEKISGIFHSFTGTLEEAERLLEFKEFMLGINGVVTFKKSTLPEVLKYIPLERIVLETDSPYLAPVPNRGKRNESANLRYTLSKIAEIYQVSEKVAAEITTKNALKVFKMEDVTS